MKFELQAFCKSVQQGNNHFQLEYKSDLLKKKDISLV